MSTESRTLRTTIDQAFSMLTDYQSYAEWTPDVVASTVLAREGDIVVAEFLSPYLMEEKYVLEFVHSKPTSITYRQVDQYGLRGLHGSWRLTPAGDGSGTVVTGHMELRTASWKRGVNRRRTALILRRRLEALERGVAGVATRVDGGTGPGSPTGDPFLEVLGREDAFTVRLPGARYLMTRLGG